jgi:hypothetical protein
MPSHYESFRLDPLTFGGFLIGGHHIEVGNLGEVSKVTGDNGQVSTQGLARDQGVWKCDRLSFGS